MTTPEQSTTTLGQRLYSLRKYHNLPLQELAEITGISRSNLNRYERDESKPTSEYLKVLCRFFNVSSDWLLFGMQTEELQRAGWSEFDPELKEMMDCLARLMASDNPHVRSWTIVQFDQAFKHKKDLKHNNKNQQPK